MKLTDSERAQFIALIEETYDSELWDEGDLPILRALRPGSLGGAAAGRGDVLPPAADDDCG